MKPVFLGTALTLLVLALSSCTEGEWTGYGSDAAYLTPAAASDLVPCDLDPNEPCIEISLPCTEESIYGNAGWYFHSCKDEVIQIPDGRPVYALLVSGFHQNKNLDMFHFYNFNKCIFRHTEQLDEKAYVHYAWWNNLLAPYMKKPLHNDESVPSKVLGALEAASDYLGFLYDPDTDPRVDPSPLTSLPTKAIPAEDYQFQKDAKAVLEAIRERNPDAAIILAGHSMGGDAVIRLADSLPDDFVIDLLAPIDPVGNRTCLPNAPLANPGQMVLNNTTCDGAYNFTRFQATHTDWYWWPYRISFENKSANYLYHRWQNEAAFPFDWRCPLYTTILGINFRDLGCPLQLHMLSLPLDESAVPDAYLFRHDDPRRLGIEQGSTNVQEAIWMNWLSGTDVYPDLLDYWNWGGLSDGHGEIVGFRAIKPWNPLESFPLALLTQGDWPSRSEENCDSDAIRPIDCQRVRELRQWESEPEHLEFNGWAPQAPPTDYCDERGFSVDGDYCTYCMVSGDLCSVLATLELMPVADAGPDQVIECSSANGTGVALDGSGSSGADALTYTWTGAFGTLMGESVYTYIPVGTHAIVLTVEDGDGRADSDIVNVTVMDSTAPTINVSLQPNMLWPPNHKMVDIAASIDVYDTCDDFPTVRLAAIASNEPDNGSGDGDTSNDIQGASFATDDREFELRAERAGGGRGRVYTVTYAATDSSGNAGAEASAEVVVKHDSRR
jgi:pimeloyl-ACP methyl ester carboxylesterase